MCLFISLEDRFHCYREQHATGSETHDKLSVLINDVEIVDDPEGIVKRVGGIIGLKPLDHCNDISVRDSCYFSFKKQAPVMIDRSLIENRELNFLDVFDGQDRKMPNNMIKTRAEVVNDLPSKNAES